VECGRADEDKMIGLAVPAGPTPVRANAATPKASLPALGPGAPGDNPVERAFENGVRLYTLGRHGLSSGQPDFANSLTAAIPLLKIAVQNGYRQPLALYYLGSAHLYRSDASEQDISVAGKLLERSLAIQTTAETYFDLAQVRLWDGQIERAIELYTKALDLKSRLPGAHLCLAMAYDQSSAKDSIRGFFEHLKHAKRELKKPADELFKTCRAARVIGEILLQVIEKSENDQLTDAEMERLCNLYDGALGHFLEALFSPLQGCQMIQQSTAADFPTALLMLCPLLFALRLRSAKSK
jgi:tetratricopeptide (TPR) repeat protein